MNYHLSTDRQISSVILVYATTSNRTQRVAAHVASQFCVNLEVDVFNVKDIRPDSLRKYDLIIAGSPTYGRGRLHSSWRSVVPSVSSLDLSNTNVALFALGDQRYHGQTFGRALKHLYNVFAVTGASLVGRTLLEGNQFMHCPDFAEDGILPGLLLDEISQRRLSHQRIEKWMESILGECSIQLA